MNSPAELWVARQQEVAVAYLSGSVAASRQAGVPTELQIREFGGSRLAVAAALASLLRSTGTESAALVTPAGDPEFSVLARQHGWRPRSIPFPGTIGVIDPSALFHSLRPVLDERAETGLTISASGDRTTFSAEREEYTVEAPGPLAALVFGGDTPEAADLPPAPPRIEARLRQLFPLPLLWQGYNYV